MSRRLENESAGKKPEGDKQMLINALPGLSEAIDFYDGVSALGIITPLEEYSYGSAADRLLARLREEIERFDFESAEETIGELSGLTD